MDFQKLTASVLSYSEQEEISAIQAELIAAGAKPEDIIKNVLFLALDKVGDDFAAGKAYIAEMLLVASIVKSCIAELKPILAANGNDKTCGKVIIGTVKNDLHDIGKNIVITMLDVAGFEVIDLGIDVSEETFIETLKANPDTKVLGISCLLTTALNGITETIKAIRGAGYADVKIVAGGAPVTEAFIKICKADSLGSDAASTVKYARQQYAN